MRRRQLLQMGMFALLMLFLSFSATAQRVSPKKSATKARTTKTGVSSADQKAIQEIFKDVDPSKYRLQFNNKKNVYGRHKVEMADVQQIKRVTNPVEAAGWIVFVVEGDDVIYVLAVGSSDLVSVIGREKAQKLNTIMAKYK